MNDKGKFKKSTIIIMLVAVFISIGLLASVLILKGDDEYQKTHEDFYNETAPVYTKAASIDEPEINDNSSDITITVSLDYALDNANKSSQLTEEQRDLGFKSVVCNGTDSVTYTISENKYRSFLRTYRYSIATEIENSLWRSYPCFELLDFNEELTYFTVRVDPADYNAEEGSLIAGYISRKADAYQAYSMINAGCTVEIKDYSTGENIATFNQ